MDDWVTHLPQVWIVLTGLGLAALGVVVHRDLDHRAPDDEAIEEGRIPM